MIAFSIGIGRAQSTICVPAKKGESTHWGGNLEVVDIQKKPYRKLKGKVSTLSGEPLANALVEIYTNPEYLLIDKPIDKRGGKWQKRIAACRTGVNGGFEFPKLRSGKYELRSSSEETGWNVTQMYVVVSPRGRKNRELEIVMSLGI